MTTARARFFHPIQVRYADTDAQGHVFFGNYFTYFDEALGGYFRVLGLPWQKITSQGVDFVYVSAHCDYKGSAHYEDVLHVHARMGRIGNTSFTIECELVKPDGDELIASGQITSVTVDMQTRKPIPVPDVLRQAVAAYEGIAVAPADRSGAA